MKKTLNRLLAVLLTAAMAFSLFGFAGRLMSAKAQTSSTLGAEEIRARDPHEIVSIIVKLKDAPVLAKTSLEDTRSRSMIAELKEKQAAVIAEISEKLLGKAPVDLLYQYVLLFNGFSFRGEYRLISEIKKLKGVKDCYESWSYELPEDVKPDGESSRLATSVGWINADDMWALGYTGQGQTIAVIDTGILKTHADFAAAPVDPHFNASVLQTILDNNDLCAEQRYTGGTLTGQALYYSAKIPYIYNYYRGNLDGSHSDAGSDHGTHVSSIAAGNHDSARGVAYNAQILTMQVFQPGGGAEWETILAALEDCAYLQVDALNMSLGADCGFTRMSEIDEVYDILVAAGVNCAVASGNSGYAGSGNNFSSAVPTFNLDDGVTSTPASSPAALCVAASSDSAAATPTSYSSWGTTSDLRIKPEIMAPGDNINAAVGSGGYGTKSGTSMATPHIAGGMVLVNQFVNTQFPELSETEKMQMVNTLLMCTAKPSKSGATPYSVRWQGAGQADLTAAIGTGAYIEIPGCVRPKFELGDDDDKTGVFTMTFDVVNFSSAALTYTVNPVVLLDNATSRTIGGRSAYVLSHSMQNITSQCTITKPNTVTVPAGGRTTVTVTVDVSPLAATLDQKFPVGAYIEGYITLDGNVDLSIPFLGFYGDWDLAAVFDREYYYDSYLHTNEWPAAWGTNTAKANGSLLGVNPFTTTTDFLLDRASISPNGDNRMDAIDDVRTYLLRNCEIFRYEVVDAETGEQYYVKDCEYEIKGVANSWMDVVAPVGAEEWNVIDPWSGDGLPSGTHAILRMTGFMQSFDEGFDPAANENAVWEIPVTIDNEDPDVVYWNMHDGNLDIYVHDNHYAAYVGVYSNAACTQLIAQSAIEETERDMTSLLSFNVGNRQQVWVKLGDYAYNYITQEITEGEGGSLTPVDLEGISLDPAGLTVYEGHSGMLNIVREPSNANNFETVWTSSDTSIATVTGTMLKGIVTGVNEGTCTVTATATDRNTGEVFTATATITVNDFPTLNEALNVEGGSINFTTSGSYPWEIVFTGDRVAAKSTNEGVTSSTSTVTTDAMQLEAGDKLRFEWLVSSENNYDKLRFYVNNSEVEAISGDHDWAVYTYNINQNGTYTFKWTYEKDYSVNSGDDVGMLDNVELELINPPEPQYILGDVDLSGEVNMTDALLAMRYAMHIIELGELNLLAGDVTLNGVVNMDDALLIMRYSMHLIDEF
ncbi:MAG: S8 family serine peptidase [Clostridia bacterium]|nr:S8 family serine peptidase [Clostridia bacterium]